jgi:glycine cleavage system transcriptional repressor
MTAFGKDRPGIVAEIAEIIYENKCNLEDSNMGRLADEFSLILLLSGSADNLYDRLSMDCKRLEREKDIYVFIRPLDYQYPDKTENNHASIIEVEGIDQTGIVYKVAKLLADKGINIETLSSKKKFSPNTGTAMYFMEITAKLPDTVSADALNTEFENLANELNIDIRMK